MVVVLWHDVGRLCRFLFGRCYREPDVRWRAAREVHSVVVAVFVVSSFCALCLVYLPFVCSRPRSERRVNNSVCSCHGCYTHIYLYWVMWPYRKVMYVHCVCVTFIFSGEEAGIAMG